jgi:UDP-glucose 4-epimerase
VIVAGDAYHRRRVLVTGGLGFIGLNLVAALKRAGAQVSILGHSWPVDAAGLRGLLDGVAFQEGDIRDQAAMTRAVTGREVIFNLAGRSGSSSSNSSPFEDLDVNARGQLTLLEVCRQWSPDARIVFASSRLVYAPNPNNPVPEDAPLGPISMYGTHKLTAENYHLVYAHVHGLRTSVLRMTNPYGPLQRPDRSRYGIINWFIQLAVEGRPLPIYGDGAQIRDYVHVDDVVAALLLAGADPAADGRVFNVGSGQGVAFRQMAEIVVAAVGHGSLQTLPWPADVARVETGDFVADITAIRQVLGWSPRRRLSEGIVGVVEELRAIAAGAASSSDKLAV